MLKKAFFKFVTSYNVIHHFLFFAGVFSIMSLLFATFIYVLGVGHDENNIPAIVGALITGDINKLGYSKLLQSGYFAMSSVVVLVWQSVLILKLLNRPEYLLLSNILTYYPLDYHNKSNKKEDFLVFRLVNVGYSDLYEVEVSATYRFFDQETQTFQHYTCAVKNRAIPVLSPNMPFRIYIETGVMTNIRNLYLDPAGIHDIEAEELGLAAVTKTDRPDDELIVFVTGYDSQLDQTKSISMLYKVRDIKYGRFKSINPSNGIFTESEINEKLDMVEGDGVWQS